MPKRKFDQQADEVDKIVDIIRSLEKEVTQELQSSQNGWKSKIDDLLNYLRPNQLSGAIFACVKSLDRIFSKCINHIHCTALDPPFVFQSEKKFEEVRNTELELQLLRQSAAALEATSNRNSVLSKLNIKVPLNNESSPNQSADPSKWNISPQDNQLLRQKFTQYLTAVSNLLHHNDQGLHVPAFKTLMSFVNHELQEVKQRKGMLIAWDSSLFDYLISCMVHTNAVNSQELITELQQLLEYDDIKYMVLSALGHFAEDTGKPRNTETTQMLYQLASVVVIPPQVTKFYSTKDRTPEQLAVLLKAQEKKYKLQNVGEDENNNNKAEKNKKEDEIDIMDEPEEEPKKKKKKDQTNMTIKFRDRKVEDQLDMLRLNVFRRAFQHCWLGILSLPLSDSTYKKILASTHTHIFPSMVRPAMLIDFLTQAYDRGGIYSILALHGVFILMTQHHLEYPDFYNKLYAILDETIFTAKYRVRFWRLLDLFFTSSHLPQYVVAAFIKKMCRLALTAPAHGCIVAQVFAYTLLQRHPSCVPLVHRMAEKPMTKSVLLIGENATKNYSEGIPMEELEGFDHYKLSEKDTAKSEAMRSSLWELQVMSLHYLPAVSRLTKIFQSIGKIYSVQDFDDESYQSLFEDEINRIVKEDIPLAYKDTDRLFSGTDITEGFDGWELS